MGRACEDKASLQGDTQFQILKLLFEHNPAAMDLDADILGFGSANADFNELMEGLQVGGLIMYDHAIRNGGATCFVRCQITSRGKELFRVLATLPTKTIASGYRPASGLPPYPHRSSPERAD